MAKPFKQNYKAGDKDIEIEFDKDKITPLQMRVNNGKPMPLVSTGNPRSGPSTYFAEDGSSITQTVSFIRQEPLKYTDPSGVTTTLKEAPSHDIQSNINLTNEHTAATGQGYQASQDRKLNDRFDLTNAPDGSTANIRMTTGNDGVSRFSLQVTTAEGMVSPEIPMPVTSVSWSKNDPTQTIYRFDDGATLTLPRAGGSGIYVEDNGTRHGATSENSLKDQMVRMSGMRPQQDGPSLIEQIESGSQRRREQTQEGPSLQDQMREGSQRRREQTQEGPSLQEQIRDQVQRRQQDMQQPAVDEFAPPRVYRGIGTPQM